jgi:putative peptidoglycan lipid II flippase
MPSPHSFVKHARTFALLTLVSRVLGLVRDAVIIRLLGISGLGTAFWNAFQVPNTFRRLFGEGALSAAFIPQYAQLVKHDPSLSHRFASLTLALLAGGLALLTLVLEALLALVLWLVPVPPEGRLSLLCLAFMLPFMPLICVTAALGGMLQTHGRFAAQAGAPIILNLMMIAAALGLAYGLGWSASATALGVAASVSLAGLLQVAWCLRDLRGLVAWSTVFEGAGPRCRQMFRNMVPVVIGLSAVQIGVLIEAQVLLNWPLYVGDTILGTPYPLDASAGAALTAAQRLYQFPLGIFGIALATAVFPLLARQADEPAAFADRPGSISASSSAACSAGRATTTAEKAWVGPAGPISRQPASSARSASIRNCQATDWSAARALIGAFIPGTPTKAPSPAAGQGAATPCWTHC